MDYLESAMTKLDQSMGDVRNDDHRDRLTRIAEVQAQIALVQVLERIAVQLERLGDIVDVIAVNNG